MGKHWELPYAAQRRGELAPVIDLELIGAGGDPIPVRGLVDSGADRTVLPDSFAEDLGIDINSCARHHALGSSGSAIFYESTDTVVARLDTFSFEFHPCFMSTAGTVLLGRDDFFEHFIVAFDQRKQMLSLTLYD